MNTDPGLVDWSLLQGEPKVHSFEPTDVMLVPGRGLDLDPMRPLATTPEDEQMIRQNFRGEATLAARIFAGVQNGNVGQEFLLLDRGPRPADSSRFSLVTPDYKVSDDGSEADGLRIDIEPGMDLTVGRGVQFGERKLTRMHNWVSRAGHFKVRHDEDTQKLTVTDLDSLMGTLVVMAEQKPMYKPRHAAAVAGHAGRLAVSS